jgi:ribonuclease VapC
VIVVDASAVIAMLFGEPQSGVLAARLAADPDRVISVASYIEAGTVLAGRRRSDRLRAIDDLDTFLSAAGIDLAPTDPMQARLALHARISYGRGMGHGGTLNFGDTFSSYALAKARDAPLLFVGNDFAVTDIEPALAVQ